VVTVALAWVIVPPETSISSPFLPTYQPPQFRNPRCPAPSQSDLEHRKNSPSSVDSASVNQHSSTQTATSLTSELSFNLNPYLPKPVFKTKNPGRSTVMAMFSSKRSSNSNNYHHPAMISRSVSPKSASSSTAPILASCYAASSSSTVVQGFHYSSTGTNG
jgi:hypothetical protein